MYNLLGCGVGPALFDDGCLVPPACAGPDAEDCGSLSAHWKKLHGGCFGHL